MTASTVQAGHGRCGLECGLYVHPEELLRTAANRLALAISWSSLALVACGRASGPDRIDYRPTLGRLSLPLAHADYPGGLAVAELVEQRSCGLGQSDDLLLPARQGSPVPLPGSPGLEPGDLAGLGEPRSTDSQGAREHSRGLAPFLWQVEPDYADGIKRLGLAAEIAPGAPVLSDLAAGYIELALADRHPGLLLDAYLAARRALDLSPTYLPALFNAALSQELLGLRGPASLAWHDYIGRETSGSWLSEAGTRLAALQLPPTRRAWDDGVKAELARLAADDGPASELDARVRDHPQRVREWVQHDLLARWADETDTGEADRLLGQALVLSSALERVTGDSLLRGWLEDVGADLGGEKGGARGAHRAVAAGYRALYDDWDLEGAFRHLSVARGAFEELDSPYLLWVELFRSLVLYYRQEYQAAGARLEWLDRRVDAASYPVLSARISWVRGLVGSGIGDLQAALDAYTDSLAGFCAAGERQNVAVLHALRSHSLSELGLYRAAWRHHHFALTGLGDVWSPLRRYAILETLVMNLRREGEEEGALMLADQQVAAAEQAGGAQLRQSALIRRSALLRSLGKEKEAREDAKAALATAGRVRDPSLRARLRADSHLLSAELVVERSPETALRATTAAVELYEGTSFSVLRPRAHAVRGQALERLGDPEGAYVEYREELRLLRQHRVSIQAELSRAAYLRQMDRTFDRIVRVVGASLGRHREALALADEARSWSVEAPGSPPRESGDRLAELVGAALPPAGVLLEYSFVGDDLYSWAVRGAAVRQERLVEAREKITPLVYSLLSRIGDSDSGDELSREGEALYDLLIGPVRDILAGAESLVIVAEGPVLEVPFPALRDPASERLLIEDFELSFMPSASEYVRLLGRRPPQGSGSVIVVKAGSGARDSRLPPLIHAESEVRGVASSYPEASSLDGAVLSRPALLESFAEVRILHFAGHAVASERMPGGVELMVRGDPEGLTIGAEDLENLDAPHLELVFLSACRSAGLAVDADSGSFSLLARRFLALGPRAVVGAHWDTSDLTSAELSVRFHRAYSAGLGSSAALRRAQLELARSGARADWSLFRVYGY